MLVRTQCRIRPVKFNGCIRSEVYHSDPDVCFLEGITELAEVQENLVSQSISSSLRTASSDLLYFRKFCSDVLSEGAGNANLMDDNPDIQTASLSTLEYLSARSQFERNIFQLKQICQSCMGTQLPVLECVSFDCPVLLKIFKVHDRLARMEVIRNLLDEQ